MPSDTSTQPISESASPPTSNAGTALNSSPDQAPVRLMLRTGNGDAPVSVHRGNTNEPVLIKLVVSNASQRIDEDTLAELVEPACPVDIQFCREVVPSYAIMFFEEEHEAIEAYGKLHGLMLGGLSLRCSLPNGVMPPRQKAASRVPQITPSVARAIMDPSCNVYVKNLDSGVDEKVLYYLFTAFGEITSVRIVRDGAGIHKGYGFVLFSSASAAQHATNEMHHRKVGPRKIVCAVSNQGSKLNNQAKPKAEEGPWRGTNTGVAAVLREKAVQPAWSENTTPVQKLIVVVDSSEDENEQSKVLASLLPTSSKVTELKPKSKYAEVTAKTVIGPKSEELGMAKFAPVRQFVPRSTAGMLLVPGYKGAPPIVRSPSVPKMPLGNRNI